jgi:hypothetical protein
MKEIYKWAIIENIVIIAAMTVLIIVTKSYWWLLGLIWLNYSKRQGGNP